MSPASSRASTYAIVGGLAAFGVCAYVMMRPEEAQAAPVVAVLPEVNPRADVPVREAKYAVGLAVDAQGVYVSSWPDWMQFAPDAFERAIADGAIGPANVLTHVLQRALPRMQWPPEEGTPQGEQYAQLVKVAAEWLTLEPEPHAPRLHVVE